MEDEEESELELEWWSKRIARIVEGRVRKMPVPAPRDLGGVTPGQDVDAWEPRGRRRSEEN